METLGYSLAVKIARGLRCKVITKSVETRDELEVLHNIDIRLRQNYLFHRPEATPSASFNNTSYFSYILESQHLNHIRHAETADCLVEAITPMGSSIHVEILKNRRVFIVCLLWTMKESLK